MYIEVTAGEELTIRQHLTVPVESERRDRQMIRIF
jgi:hypothetical protein